MSQKVIDFVSASYFISQFSDDHFGYIRTITRS